GVDDAVGADLAHPHVRGVGDVDVAGGVQIQAAARLGRLAAGEAETGLDGGAVVVEHARGRVGRVLTVAGAGGGVDDARCVVHLAHHLVRLIGDVEVAVGVELHRHRQIQRGHRRRAAVAGEPAPPGAAHVGDGAAREVDGLHAAVVPGGDHHEPI